jgi:hypothetical protein
MTINAARTKPAANRPLLFLLFLLGGVAVFLFGNNWTDRFPTNESTLYKWGLVFVYLAIALIMRRSERFREYWEVAYALFIAASAVAVNWLLGNWLGRLFPTLTGAQGLAIEKVAEALPVVLTIILLTKAAGNDLGSIFLKRGNLRWGLRFGLISFGVFAAIFAVIAVLQAGAPSSEGLFATGVPLPTLVAALPWILLWAFANSLMEELWFRGIFLGKLSPLLGAAATIVVTALVFSIPHAGATYISSMERILFSSVVFGLGLLNGYVMLKTNSIIGSVLFHAGYDLLVVIPVLVSL